MVPAGTQDFLVSRCQGIPLPSFKPSNTGLYHRLWFHFPKEFFSLNVLRQRGPYNPNIAVTTLVWANPRSLATSRIIIIFFSCKLLRCFRFPALASCCHSFRMSGCPIRKSSDQGYLPEAYRGLSRPSSPRGQGIRHAPPFSFFSLVYLYLYYYRWLIYIL